MNLNCEFLDASDSRSDNATGDIPFIAPMKIKFFKSAVPKDRRRCGVGLSALFCVISAGLIAGAAQLKTQKRITALQLGEAADGSRVTIISDSVLNDYEAFRRGDRFYVRIPLADFTSALPRLHGDGFDDVQVQKVADSLVVSFKLQPGASARVDQRSNRLDVIFSAPLSRLRRDNPNAVANRMPSTTGQPENPQPLQDRRTETAGPMPPGSVLAYRERIVTPRVSEGPKRQNSSRRVVTHDDSNRTSATTKSMTTTGNSLPVKTASPATVLPPSGSPNYPTLTTATPATSANVKPAITTPTAAESPSLKSRGRGVLQWASANRLATLLAALLVLSFLLYVFVILRRGRRKVAKVTRANVPLAQPKYTPSVELDDTSAGSIISPASSKPSSEYVSEYTRRSESPASFVTSNSFSADSTQEKPEWGRLAPDSVLARSAAAGTPQNNAWVATKSTVAPFGGQESSGEEQEREVFEL
jgi:hypothetical protein